MTMPTVLLTLGIMWIAFGLYAFFNAAREGLARPLPPEATVPEKLMIQLLVDTTRLLELIIAALLISFGVLFIAASRYLAASSSW